MMIITIIVIRIVIIIYYTHYNNYHHYDNNINNNKFAKKFHILYKNKIKNQKIINIKTIYITIKKKFTLNVIFFVRYCMYCTYDESDE